MRHVDTVKGRIMLLTTGIELVGHGSTMAGVLEGAARRAEGKRLLRRSVAIGFLLTLAGIGLAFPML